MEEDEKLFLNLTDVQNFTDEFISCIAILRDGKKVKCVGKRNLHDEGKKLIQLQKTPLGQIIPKIYGLTQIGDTEYIIMENLSADFTSPCHLDIKLGFRSWDINAPPETEKKLRERSLMTTSRNLAFRLDRGEFFRNGKCLMHLRKGYLANLNVDWVSYTLNSFMPLTIYEQFYQTILHFIQIYKEMLNSFPNFRVYSGSVLLYYDSDHLDYPPRIRFIDLAHSHLDVTKNGGDLSEECNDHVLDGLINLSHFTENSNSPYIGHYYIFLTDSESDSESETEIHSNDSPKIEQS